MAVATVTLQSASRNMLKYKLIGGAGDSANIDAANAATPDLITDSQRGSDLRNLLATVVGNQAAGRALLFDRSDLVLSILPRDADACWWVDGDTDGAAHLRLTVTATAADATGTYLTIEYKHSFVR
jgi:hypothetical protein